MPSRQCLVASAFVRDGKLRLSKSDAFAEAVRRMRNCRMVLRLEEHLDPRRVGLNAFYWGVLIDQISNETGMTEAEAHQEMKQLHLSKKLAALRGNGRIEGVRVFDGTTRDLSGPEEWDYIERIYGWSATTLDLVLPNPHDGEVVAA